MGHSYFLAGISAFLLWGLSPLFWHELHELPPFSIVANRIVWSSIWAGCTLMMIRLLRYRTRPDREKIKGGPRIVEPYSALAIGVQWGAFIWAIDSGLVLAASLGYFIAPLLYVASGRLIHGESLIWDEKSCRPPRRNSNPSTHSCRVLHHSTYRPSLSWLYCNLRQSSKTITALPSDGSLY